MITKEGNRLIAEFMGFKYIEDGDLVWNKVVSLCIEKLKYHSSWEWLMPVVEKIESLGFLTTIKYRNSKEDSFHEIIISKNNRIFGESLETMEQILEAENYSKIQAVWNGVINFIEKYNENISSLQS